MDTIFQEMGEIEQTRDPFRPITLNMVGLVLDRFSLGERVRLPTYGEAGGFVSAYLRSCLARADVRDYAPTILGRMITRAGTKEPKTVGQVAEETGRSPDLVRGCLLQLAGHGLVRQVDAPQDLWEISHDFVAHLLNRLVSQWREALWERIRLWLPAGALTLWAITALWSVFLPQWYERIPLKKIPDWSPEGDYHIHRAVTKPHAAAAVKYLKEHGADVNAPNASGETALHIAAELGKVDVVEALLATDKREINALEINAMDNAGRTPLHSAAERGRSEVVKLLLAAGADRDAQNHSQETPMHLAARIGQVEVVKLLLDAGADKDTQDEDGDTPLHMAARAGEVQVVELLLEEEAEKDAQGMNGLTPLHYAAGIGHVEVVELLLDKEADTGIQDAEGRTALDLAREFEKTEVLQLIEEHLQKSARPVRVP